MDPIPHDWQSAARYLIAIACFLFGMWCRKWRDRRAARPPRQNKTTKAHYQKLYENDRYP